MLRPRVLLAAITIALLLIGGNSYAPSRPAAAQNSAAAILQEVNAVRAEYGLPPFQWNDALSSAAKNQANYMAANNIYSHVGAGGSSPQSRANAAGYNGRVSENIVGGTNLTPSQGVVWWRNSPTHFNTMVSAQYTQAGVGFAQGAGQNFYALVVGNPGGAPPPASQPPAQNETVIAAVAPITLNAPDADGSITHIVGDGHTFWAIAARYEVDLADLYLYNNMKEGDFIQAGDELIIQLGEGQSPPPTPTPPASHIVQEGDTAWTIAAWYKISLADLLWMNGMAEDDFLRAGDEVIIRLLPGQVPPPTPTPQQTYFVQPGDTIWEIALRHGITLEQILEYNQLTAEALLAVGMELRIAPRPTPRPEPLATVTPTPPPTAVLTITATAVAPAAPSNGYPAPETTTPPSVGGYIGHAGTTAVDPTSIPANPDSGEPESTAVQVQPASAVIGLIVVGLLLLGGAIALWVKQG